MRVLMLGWEFPPYITGGLGTACHGLTKALDQLGVSVTFVLPKGVAGQHADHVDLVSPETAAGGGSTEVAGLAGMPGMPGMAGMADIPVGGDLRGPRTAGRAGTAAGQGGGQAATPDGTGFENVRFIPVEAGFAHPYQQDAADGIVGEWTGAGGRGPGALGRGAAPGGDAGSTGFAGGSGPAPPHGAPHGAAAGQTPAPAGDDEYGGDLIHQVERYASFCLRAAQGHEFDVIHAHDWMTYPAGLWIARLSGKPLVVHVHSTEFDRSGEHINQRVYDIERRGMHGAMRVIAVSQLTKNVCVNRYGVTDQHVDVVYNGVDLESAGAGLSAIRRSDKIVLYFGRITYQKGPEYFVRAAMRVLEHLDDVKFVVAGSGDQARSMIEMAANMGIGHKVLFTGFLRGDDIRKVFALADLYVMPSISEPFGIAPLEAMGHDVPVLISKTSGVSEVLQHALKVDFWDVDDMANKIIAVLRHPPLSQTLKEHGRFEVRRITWEGAAQKCERIYHAVVEEMTHPVGVHA